MRRKSILARIRRFWFDESGPTAVEYGVMLALIILVCFTAIQAVGNQVSSSFNNSKDEIESAFGS